MKTFTFHLILLVLTLSTSIIAHQQESWTTFTTANGLADNRVIGICHATDSTSWFGTDGRGVSHYANELWTTFTIAEDLSNNIVNLICVIRNKTLWFGTYNGITCYQDGIWTTFTTANGLTEGTIHPFQIVFLKHSIMLGYRRGTIAPPPDGFGDFFDLTGADAGNKQICNGPSNLSFMAFQTMKQLRNELSVPSPGNRNIFNYNFL